MSGPQHTPRTFRWLRIGMLLSGYALIMVLGHFGGRWLEHKLAYDPVIAQSVGLQLAFATGLLVYVILLALPFVPGIEISLALFAAFGAKAALPIYGATLVALLVAYGAGRYVPLASLSSFFDYIGLQAGASLVRRLGQLEPRQRVEALAEIAPTRFGGYVVRYRELALIAALNLPGNALIGGGGGIALLAGMSGLFPLGRYLLAIMVAALPIPLTMALAAHGWR